MKFVNTTALCITGEKKEITENPSNKRMEEHIYVYSNNGILIGITKLT